MENLLDKSTQLWVKVCGRRIDPLKDAWLIGPVGDAHVIGYQIIEKLANEGDLEIDEHSKNAGLLESMDVIGLTKEDRDILRPEIADFYERTSTYHMEMWSEWCGIFRPFGYLLSYSPNDFNN